VDGLHGFYRDGMGVPPIGQLLALLKDALSSEEVERLARSDPLFRLALRGVLPYDSSEHERLDTLLAEFPDEDVNDR
jgi:hypothetical protein